ncbi:hypothetical protein [Geotalea uraniireducens]|uniref:hypothetical protein n=1 Tax=Geotalea uraniireducens TaxID=351604 RepID=UPI00030ECCE8|nr:hypothetical protein [Geotalea uraniireducens]
MSATMHKRSVAAPLGTCLQRLQYLVEAEGADFPARREFPEHAQELFLNAD